MYRATGNLQYYSDTRGRYYNWGQFSRAKADSFSWDAKTLGTQLLLTQVTRGDLRIQYMQPLVGYCEAEYENRARHTPKGLWWYSEWSPTRYALNGAFLCYQVAEYTHNDDPQKFAEDQVDYILGKSGWSYVIGYKGTGDYYPVTPHHRASSCPPKPADCKDYASMADNPKPNVNVLYVRLS